MGLGEAVIATENAVERGGAILFDELHNPDVTLKRAKQSGVCLENDLPSSDIRFSANNGEEYKVADALVEMYDLKRRFDYIIGGQSITDWIWRGKTGPAGDFVKSDPAASCGEWRKLMPGLFNKDLIAALTESTRQDFVHALFKKSCRNRIPIKHLHGTNRKTKDGLTPSDLLRDLDKQLENGNIALIAYNGRMLFDRYSDVEGGHASTVVARRFNTESKKCEYLIKNSYGEDCEKYDPELKKNCKDGFIWAPEEYIARGLTHLFYIN